MDLKADKQSLKKLLSTDEQQFRIPPYQRPYSWTSEEVDDLWEDLLDNLPTGHFLGSLVLSTENESLPLVIDGQQRLTTLMLLMAAVRDQCHQRDMAEQVQRIDKRLTADDFATGDGRFKFKTGSVNWPVFRDFFLRSPIDPGRKTDLAALDKDVRARNRLLLENAARLRGHLESHLAGLSADDQRVWLADFDKTLLQRAEFVVIEVSDLGDAFLLFETLNDRGLQLSAADLLKSHLLGQIASKESDEDVEAASRRWDEVLEELGAQVDVTRFLRHYLLGSVPKVNKEEVFDHFKKRVKSVGAHAVLDEISTAAHAYGEFENPQRVSHEPTRRVLNDLQTLRAVTCYVALLPARRYLSEIDFVEFARLAEVLTYRYSSVVGYGSKELERKYHEAAKLLIESHGAAVAEARSVLIGMMPSSEIFVREFERQTMGRQYLLKYTLRKIEESLATSKEKELKTSGLVHIEHIMPQQPSQPWRDSLGADLELHEQYLNRWGNLTLLYWDLNITASNDSFSHKVTLYDKSEVELTRRLCRERVWGIAEIEARQRWLGRVADRLWSVESEGVASLANETSVRRPTDVFADALGEVWPAVAPFLTETTAEDVKQLAERLPGHLVNHPTNRPAAERIAGQLASLLESWESYDGEQRAVVRAAVAYFLESNDAVPDHTFGGLVDDEAVVDAAFAALGRADQS
jgi:hypothetical protein